MKIAVCDWCDSKDHVGLIEVDGREYDICAKCRTELTSKLKGKGTLVLRETAPVLPYVPVPHAPWWLEQPWIWTDTGTGGFRPLHWAAASGRVSGLPQ